MATTIFVPGLKEALHALRKVDPELYRELRTNLNDVTAPMRMGIQNNLPKLQDFGWKKGEGFNHDGRTGWDKNRVKIKTVLKTQPKRRGPYVRVGTVSIRVQSAAIEILDMAGKRNKFKSGVSRPYAKGGVIMTHTLNGQGEKLVGFLNNFGQASRFVWPAAEKYLPTVNVEVDKILQRVIMDASKRLAA